MKIYNSLTNKLEEFKPIQEGKISMYVCGPTVYNYAHIGNMVPVIFFDTVYRYFKYKGFDIKYASNFTDVDDKIILAAIELNKTEKEVTEKFIEAFLNDTRSFNCLDVDYRPKVTESMPAIIAFIQLLIDKEFAYEIDGDVYFRVSKVKDYGKLSNQKLENLESGNRIEIDNKKENPYDFVLWKKTTDGIKWNAPFGEGRPGWHTECVVMINNIFGGKIDIHGGGVDIKFPHHENEVAQSNAAWEHSLANYWMHNGSLMVNGEKMSKSLGNFILAYEIREKYSANQFRIAILKTHYRLPINLTEELFEDSKTIDEKIYNVLKQAILYISVNNLKIAQIKTDSKFEEYMDNDFNTANVISYLLELVKELNTAIRNNDNTQISQLYDSILIITDVLGLKYETKELSEDDKILYRKWMEYRDNKNFEKADELRTELLRRNIL